MGFRARYASEDQECTVAGWEGVSRIIWTTSASARRSRQISSSLPNNQSGAISAASQWSTKAWMFNLLAALVHGEFFVQTSNHLANSRLGKTFSGHRMILSQFVQPILQDDKFLLCFLILVLGLDHNCTSTTPFRRPSFSRFAKGN